MNGEERLLKLIVEFDTLCREIEDELNKITQYDEAIKKNEENLKKIRLEIEYEVNVLTKEDGKTKMYPNQTARDNETYKRLDKHSEYGEIRIIVEENRSLRDKARDNIEVLKYRFRAAQSKVDIESILQSTRHNTVVTPMTGKIT